MELKHNMYVRTKNGCICQILRTTYSKYLSRNKELCYEVDRPINVNMELYDEDVSKASHNIIDLIEVGDYLNGFKVSKIERYDTKTIIKIGNSTFNVLEGEEIYTPSYDNNNGYEKLEKLKSILTREQFESMKYEVE